MLKSLKPCYTSNIRSIEGSRNYFLTPTFGFSQIINKLTRKHNRLALILLVKHQSCHHIETSQLICSAIKDKLISIVLHPQPWLEGSYKIGSFCLSFRPSFCLSVSFLGIGSLVFSELSMVLGAHIQLCMTAWFFWKKSLLSKNDQKLYKLTQNRVFGIFKKITSLVLFAICVKWKFLWFINILRKLHTWEKSVSQAIAKNDSRLMRFKNSLIANMKAWPWVACDRTCTCPHTPYFV